MSIIVIIVVKFHSEEGEIQQFVISKWKSSKDFLIENSQKLGIFLLKNTCLGMIDIDNVPTKVVLPTQYSIKNYF